LHARRAVHGIARPLNCGVRRVTNVTATIVAAAGLLLGACEHDAADFDRPKQTPEAVLRAVTEHMTSKGTTMEKYELDSLSFDYVQRRWWLGFNGKSLLIGDHFSVQVSDEDMRKLEVVPGL
jgi:hypothetical protein